jgi:hypothetical protein
MSSSLAALLLVLSLSPRLCLLIPSLSLSTSSLLPFLRTCLYQDLEDFIDKHPRPQDDSQKEELPVETCMALNFLADFIFREVRDTLPIRQ